MQGGILVLGLQVKLKSTEVQDVEFIVCPVHCYNITKENWFTTEKGIDRVLGELARCGNQFVGDIKAYLSVGD